MKSAVLSNGRSKSDKMYVIREAGTSYVKIGITNNLERRLRTLQTANPHTLEMVYKFNGTPSTIKGYESIIHKKLKSMGRHIRGEWFFIHPNEIEDVLTETGVLVFTKGGRV